MKRPRNQNEKEDGYLLRVNETRYISKVDSQSRENLVNVVTLLYSRFEGSSKKSCENVHYPDTSSCTRSDTDRRSRTFTDYSNGAISILIREPTIIRLITHFRDATKRLRTLTNKYVNKMEKKLYFTNTWLFHFFTNEKNVTISNYFI